MRLPNFLAHVLFALSATSSLCNAARKSADSVLLSNVKTLTVRSGLKTSHRRVAAVPQVWLSILASLLSVSLMALA